MQARKDASTLFNEKSALVSEAYIEVAQRSMGDGLRELEEIGCRRLYKEVENDYG